MNYRLQEYDYVVTMDQLEEAVSSFVKFLLFLRSSAKYSATEKNKSCEAGSVGYEGCLCYYINMGYVKPASEELDRDLTASISEFTENLKKSKEVDGERRGKLTVVFYEVKTRENSWLPTSIDLPWEMWVANIRLVKLRTLLARERHAKASSEKITDIMFKLATDVGSATYVPDNQVPADKLDSIFCTKYSDIQPFLFKIVHETGFEQPMESLQAGMRRFFNEVVGI